MFIAPDGKQASVSYSSTMDMSIIKEVFSAVLSAAEVELWFYACELILGYTNCIFYSKSDSFKNRF